MAMYASALANLSKLADYTMGGLRVLLIGRHAISNWESAFEIQRSLPHCHVASVLRTLKHIKPESVITNRASRQRELITAKRTESNYPPRFQSELQVRTIYRYSQQHTLRNLKSSRYRLWRTLWSNRCVEWTTKGNRTKFSRQTPVWR
jgi:hypothetical protein